MNMLAQDCRNYMEFEGWAESPTFHVPSSRYIELNNKNFSKICTYTSLPICFLFHVPFIGKPAEDEISLSALNLKPKMKIMMMGTREEALVRKM